MFGLPKTCPQRVRFKFRAYIQKSVMFKVIVTGSVIVIIY